jgi:hypothetical protein
METVIAGMFGLMILLVTQHLIRERFQGPPQGDRGVLHLDLRVDVGTLRLGPGGMWAATGSLSDLARLHGEVTEVLDRLTLYEARIELGDGGLLVVWRGSPLEHAEIEALAHRLRDALARAPESPWERIESALQAKSRDRLLLSHHALAGQDPFRENILRALMEDPDPEVTRAVLRKHGTRGDWMAAALSTDRPLSQRQKIVTWWDRSHERERCHAAVQFAGCPELGEAVCKLIGTARGEEAETAWLVLLECSQDRTVLKTAVTRLGEVGGRRSVMPLYQLKERTGPLQLQLKAEVTSAIESLQARLGGSAGMLSLASPPVETGALSVAKDRGGLSES